MTWVTPSTAPADGRIGYTRFVDEIVNNVNELYHRRADTLSSIFPSASTGTVAANVALAREMRSIEIGGIDDWTSLDTIEGEASVNAGGGPGVAFTIPKGMSGLWRFVAVGGSTISAAATVQVMWSYNSTQTSTGFTAHSTDPAAWTYQWCMGSMGLFSGTHVDPSGLMIDRFSSGDKLRFYTVARLPTGSTYNLTHGSGLGIFARVWAQFLGTTV